MTTDRKLDHALRAWARTDPLHEARDEAALLRILGHADALAMSGPTAEATARNRPRWWLGGLSAVAASIMVLALTGPTLQMAGFTAFDDDSSMIFADADLDDGLVFALLFTPTNDEEYQL